jgi:chemotaxis protein MotB
MAKSERSGNGKARPIIIRREESSGGGHHGGAWKVAYADFVTAMMAFFLVMWLINATTEDQRKGLADYFSPTNLMSHNSSGTGKPFGGKTAFENGAMVSDRGAVQITQGLHPVLSNPAPQQHPPNPHAPRGGGTQDGAGDTPGPLPSAGAAARARPVPLTPPPQGAGPAAAAPPAPAAAPASPPPASPQPASPRAATLSASLGASPPAATGAKPAPPAAFAAAKRTIERLVRADPALAAIASQVAIDITPRGLRIQLLDSRRQAMFATGSAIPTAPARLLLGRIAPVLARLAGPVRISGYTDAAPFPGPGLTNWDLSAARANAARQVMTAAGLPDPRFQAITGHGDRDLLLPRDPLAPANRRISILVLRRPAPAAAPAVAPAAAPVVAPVVAPARAPARAPTAPAPAAL